jgi:hypothetical protein
MHRSCSYFLVLVGALLVAGCDRGAVGTPDAGTGGASGGGAGSGGAGGQAGGCAFSATYRITDGGGLVPQLDTATLSPPNAFSYDRRSFVSDAGQPSCAPALPACHANQVDVSDVEAAIAHPDVQNALAQATPPTYGQRNIADGPNFSFMRADNHGFNNGLECSPASSTCTPTPAGVHALMLVLRQLITQQLADPSCAGFRQ